MIKKLTPYLSKYKLYTIITPLLIIAEVMLEVTIPFLMAKIVDDGIGKSNIPYVLKIGTLMIIMSLFSLTFGALASKTAAKAAMGFGSEVRKGLFNKVQEFSFSNVDKFSTASLVTRLTTDVNNIQNAFMMVIRLLVRSPVMLVSAMIMAFSINRSLVSVFLVAVPFLATALALIIMMAFPRFTSMLKKYDKINASVQENLIAIRVVKAFVRSNHEKDKFRLANDDLMKASLKAEKVVIWNMPIMMLSMYGCIIAILWFGGNMVIGGTMLTGSLLSFISYVTQILMSLMMLSMVFINLILSKASLNRIFEVLDEKVNITNPENDNTLTANDGSIEFKNVSFKYNISSESNTLENINLSIKSGETIGIIGGTGSAKTTLVQLIPRLYDVNDGEIFVGGHDVRNYKLNVLRD